MNNRWSFLFLYSYSRKNSLFYVEIFLAYNIRVLRALLLIDSVEKYDRKVEKRREAGIRPMEEYNEERKKRTEDML
ncbi:hypothetical protein [Ectobacillus panaciterrae]|uniref:hypothetical protein n=1 Tax=Ectobacillus panaciterrae TaxID=363872 RepID=UPI000414E419|nr:hypothetical protein [Ectobacillus panaciterrae]